MSIFSIFSMFSYEPVLIVRNRTDNDAKSDALALVSCLAMFVSNIFSDSITEFEKKLDKGEIPLKEGVASSVSAGVVTALSVVALAFVIALLASAPMSTFFLVATAASTIGSGLLVGGATGAALSAYSYYRLSGNTHRQELSDNPHQQPEAIYPATPQPLYNPNYDSTLYRSGYSANNDIPSYTVGI